MGAPTLPQFQCDDTGKMAAVQYFLHLEQIIPSEREKYLVLRAEARDARNKRLRETYRRRQSIIGKSDEKVDAMSIFERDKWICQLCPEFVDKELKYPNPAAKSLDHIIPLIQGGTHTANNLQLAHKICNSHKGGTLFNVSGVAEQLRHHLMASEVLIYRDEPDWEYGLSVLGRSIRNKDNYVPTAESRRELSEILSGFEAVPTAPFQIRDLVIAPMRLMWNLDGWLVLRQYVPLNQCRTLILKIISNQLASALRNICFFDDSKQVDESNYIVREICDAINRDMGNIAAQLRNKGTLLADNCDNIYMLYPI